MKMRRIGALALLACLVMALAGCGGGEKETKSQGKIFNWGGDNFEGGIGKI